eukprot:CAMPEP_0114618080 /NCGR_PEP_ID=MMETSP0168-20121206/7523_1 /TAXON_ID=95228 ORGANISM="Vannella sp., Strain DIVA3 517/6/12" /NCGR_SAMPLE_ID=MMETSP0168 /ASSEMBLY_ACC=CAM_ASM_000044 /LENGTH=434 /DNA_ID=CAMNT_0001829225 /DNA_START=9 /DNA_END=1310 /DNA_ORIENTATION=-
MDTELAKGAVIKIFRNGDIHHKGERLVIHHTKFLTFDQVLDEATRRVKLPTGTVRRIFAADGREMKALSDFENQGCYICCGAHKLKKDQLPKAATGGARTPTRSAGTPTKSGTPKKQKFGVQTEKGKVIWVYRNGDKHHTGDRFVVHESRYKKLDQLYAAITDRVGISTGAVRKLVVIKNDRPALVRAFSDIQDHTNVVACGAEGVKKSLLHPSFFEVREKESKKEARLPTVDQETPVSIASPQKPSTPSKRVPSATKAGSGTPKKVGTPAKSGTPSKTGTPKKMEKFGTQTSKGVVIYVYRNGDKHDEGTRMVIHEKKHRRLDQVHAEMTKKVGIFTGAVRKVYAPNGAIVKNISDFKDQCEYICSGAEPLKKNLISANLIARRKARLAEKKAASAEAEAAAAEPAASAAAQEAAAPAAEQEAAPAAAEDDDL